MSIKEVFERMAKDVDVLSELEANPIQFAVFMALRDYVKAGNDLFSLPWFALVRR